MVARFMLRDTRKFLEGSFAPAAPPPTQLLAKLRFPLLLLAVSSTGCKLLSPSRHSFARYEKDGRARVVSLGFSNPTCSQWVAEFLPQWPD